MKNISEIFEESGTDIESKLTDMAEFAALEENEILQLESQIKERRENLDKLKSDMAQLMIQAGFESVKLRNGLTPKTRTVVRFYKKVNDEALFDWLKSQGLGEIIKPYVHFQTLQGALSDYEAMGKEVPETIFQRSEKQTITLYGKSKFLSSKKTDTAPDKQAV